MTRTYEVIREAVQTQRRVIVVHRNRWVAMCPHVLGWARDEAFVLAYRLFADAESDPRTGPLGYWDRLPVRELSDARLAAGPWLPGTNVARPLSGLEFVDVDVARSEQSEETAA